MPSPLNGVIISVTFRATMGRRRALLFAVPAVVLIAVAALLAATAHSGSWQPEFLGDFGFTIVLPLTSLIIGTSVLGAEIDDGSVVHLLATPVPRSQVVLSKFVVAAGLTILLGAIPEYLGAAIAAGPGSRLAVGLLAGAVAAAVIYNALFVMLSALTTRAIAIGLIYLLVWEGLLANLVPGVGLLSAGQYSLSIANGIASNKSLHAHLTVTTAVVMGLIVTLAALVICTRKLAVFSIRGDAA
ncbi:MAG TPA: ABC transporter permease [Streptosporangiaceae bacterium]|jgi:ABC-2 type transport system permease protein|nr:ABC transporter permease [Streptosporangiaceae bacterium]